MQIGMGKNSIKCVLFTRAYIPKIAYIYVIYVIYSILKIVKYRIKKSNFLFCSIIRTREQTRSLQIAL